MIYKIIIELEEGKIEKDYSTKEERDKIFDQLKKSLKNGKECISYKYGDDEEIYRRSNVIGIRKLDGCLMQNTNY